ncbi:hypothetical protein CNEO3_260003 [Clostridium neonatale]|uniref:Uncharacterized protein n=2 Tax=Clostridium neonatale TaxID=137838 RepID=A0AA86JH11_9CLOT|nr:hypothetical protein CNEO_42668 [Clostridium neonatale]CAG9718394.1 hypothetical protein CNEO_780004 [Clostridium neonatale]CAI3544743.1 hypothetical protein CNEO4_250003 [Clostridium neonatale]CAI3545446.1 hypothetical protein CNEO3_1170003 [Clostridium neonatale]CAI3546448.1 hypothetical protein CNEO3_1010003 [Clostridium neonatale]
MRLAFSSASSENPECAEKNRRLKGLRFIKAIVFYWICIFIEDYIIVALAIFLCSKKLLSYMRIL